MRVRQVDSGYPNLGSLKHLRTTEERERERETSVRHMALYMLNTDNPAVLRTEGMHVMRA